MKHILFSLLTLGLTVSPAMANTASKFLTFSWTSRDDMPELIKAARKRGQVRTVASSHESATTKEYRSIRDEVLNVKTGEELHVLLTKIEAKVENYDDEGTQFLGTLLLLLKPMRGIVYKMIPLASEHRITHSQLRTMVRSFASNMRLYLPIRDQNGDLVPMDHWAAGFAYLTEPYEAATGKAVVQFKTTGDLQDHLQTHVYPNMAETIQRIEKLSLNKPILWDNRMVFGPESYKGDEDNRFRYIYQGEKRLALSSLHLGIHYLHYVLAYNFDDAFKLAKDVGKLYGLDGFMFKEVDGVPSYRLSTVVNKYPKIFTLKAGGQEHMKESFSHFKEGITQLRLAREEIRGQAVAPLFLINPDRVNAWDEEMEAQLKMAECLTENIKAVCPARSPVTGHTVKVSLGNFYSNPPKDMKDLMPKAWDLKTKTNKNAKLKVEWPNYYWGMPTEWNPKSYKAYFPEITDSAQVPQFVRTLRHAKGAEFFGAPFALFVE